MSVELCLSSRMMLSGVFVAVLFSASSAFAGDCFNAYMKPNHTEALRLCQPLAEQGDLSAQSALGSMY